MIDTSSQLQRYFDWMEDRGLSSPPSPRQLLEEAPVPVPAEAELQSDSELETEKKSATPVISAPAAEPEPMSDEVLVPEELDSSINPSSCASTTDPQSEEERYKNPYLHLRCAEYVFLFTELPTGTHLQTLTKLMHALDLRDHSFAVISWESQFEPGTLLDHLGESECQVLVVFDKALSEILLDQNFSEIAFSPLDTAYNFQTLASTNIESLASQPQLKVPLWKGLLDIFSIKKH